MSLTSEQTEVLKVLLRRRNIYTALLVLCDILGGVSGVIPVAGWYISTALLVLGGIFAGFGMMAINVYRYTKSQGRRQGGGLWWWALVIFGFVVVPVVTVLILKRLRGVSERILGVTLSD